MERAIKIIFDDYYKKKRRKKKDNSLTLIYNLENIKMKKGKLFTIGSEKVKVIWTGLEVIISKSDDDSTIYFSGNPFALDMYGDIITEVVDIDIHDDGSCEFLVFRKEEIISKETIQIVELPVYITKDPAWLPLPA